MGFSGSVNGTPKNPGFLDFGVCQCKWALFLSPAISFWQEYVLIDKVIRISVWGHYRVVKPSQFPWHVMKSFQQSGLHSH